MDWKKVVCIDFETMPIEDRPFYPPEPVGVAIKWPGKRPKYYAWAHRSGKNKHTFDEAKAALKAVWESDYGILCHNSKFDLEVAHKWFNLPIPKWERIHDTMPMLFLLDPRAKTYALKPTSEALLGMPPEERDAVQDWLIVNQPIEGLKLRAGVQRGKSSPAPYIAYAPASVVGPYAIGDVTRTVKLAKHCYKQLQKRDMVEAYDRERHLIPFILDMERQGLRVDLPRLEKDIETYQDALERLEVWLRKKLRKKDLNLNAGEQLAEALIKAKLAKREDFGVTEKAGKLATNKDALHKAVKNPQVLAALQYRSKLLKCLNTFMVPWYEVARTTGGYIYTSWFTTRTDKNGARTGRMSSTPNFQNLARAFEDIFENAGSKAPVELPKLPILRSYVIPYMEDHVLIDRDYCFSEDTEILTEEGFVPFPKLDSKVRVAQWKDGKITYAWPKAYQVLPFDGELVHIQGSKTTDLLVTPNHRCLIDQEWRGIEFVAAEDYPRAHARHFNAGVLEGGRQVNPMLLRLVVALQADASVKDYNRVVWFLKKRRKIERLFDCLEVLGIEYTTNNKMPSKPGYTRISISKEELLSRISSFFVGDAKTKTFCKWALKEMDLQSRLMFLKELPFWDGSEKAHGPSFGVYCSTNLENVETVQEIAVLSGCKGVSRYQDPPGGRKRIGAVSIIPRTTTYVDRFTKTYVPYSGHVYCVTMPESTVIVRRNGRVSVTGQSQQELRILAHYEEGDMFESYRQDPTLDAHNIAAKLIKQKSGMDLDRYTVKTLWFAIIYGLGLGRLAEKLEITVNEARELKNALLDTFPGVRELGYVCRDRGKKGDYIRTWGGREYYVEEPKVINGEMRTFEYRLLNILIQGSAADCTKEALIRYYEKKPKKYKVLLVTHDQLTVSVPRKDRDRAMKQLKKCMESVPFDVPMLSDGKWSPTNFAALEQYDKQGKIYAN